VGVGTHLAVGGAVSGSTVRGVGIGGMVSEVVGDGDGETGGMEAGGEGTLRQAASRSAARRRTK